LRADSAAAYPSTIPLDIAGLPVNFMPLFAGGRSAFVPDGDQVVVHGGVSVDELIVPFVNVGAASSRPVTAGYEESSLRVTYEEESQPAGSRLHAE
jgi:hypothetical protein